MEASKSIQKCANMFSKQQTWPSGQCVHCYHCVEYNIHGPEDEIDDLGDSSEIFATEVFW